MSKEDFHEKTRGKQGMSKEITRNKLILLTVLLFMATLPGVSFADTVADRKIVVSKAYVDTTKQNKITTGNILLDSFDSTNVYVPGLVAYDSSTGSLKGNQIGILDQSTLDSVEFSLDDFYTRDDLVPTVAAVSTLANQITSSMPNPWSALTWDSTTMPSAINTYGVNFDSTSTHVNGNWPYQHETKLVIGKTFANGLALKQNKIPATLDSSYHSVLTDSDTDGEVGKIQIVTMNDLHTNRVSLEDMGNTIPTSDAVFYELDAYWQPKISATSNGADSSPNYVYDSTNNPTAAGSVVTTTTTAGLTGQRGIATAPTYDSNNALSNGDWLPTMSAVMSQISSATERIYTSDNGDTINVISAILNSIDAYSTTFSNSGANWPSNSKNRLVNGETFAIGLARKQNVIPAKANGDPTKIVTYPAYGSAAGAIGELSVDTSTLYTTDDSHVPSSKLVSTSLSGKQNQIGATSNGTSGSPNYVYDSTNNPTAAGSVVTTTTNAGETGQRGIATAPTYDTGNNLTNDSWIPTMGAVMNQISSATNTLRWDSSETASANAYETHFGSGTNQWPAVDETKLINTSALAQGLALKQNVIPHVANGTRETKIVTYPDAKSSDGAIGELTVDTSELNKFDDTSVPSSKLVADQMAHTVNGAPLSNSASYFYGTGVGAADTATKTVSIRSLTGTPEVGQVIIVNPETTNTSSTIGINLNNTTAYSVYYRGSGNNIPVDVWTAGVPSVFVLDSTGGNKPVLFWRYVGMSPNALSWSTTTRNATNAYSTTFDGTSNNWTAPDAGKYVKGDSFANGLALKQNQIAATSNGTSGSPNYVYDSTNNPTAAGSVVTTTDSAGVTGQRGIATAPTRDNNGDLTNGDWIPTMSAVVSELGEHKINGVPLSTGGYFYGEGVGSAATALKTVSIPSIPSTTGTNPPTGLMIIVKPVTATNSSSTMQIKLNDFDAASVNYRGSTSSLPTVIWTQYALSAFVFDGTYWRYMGDGNTTYSTMTISEGRTGTSENVRSMTAKNLKAIIHGTKLTDAAASAITFTPQNAAINALTDDLMTALGKLQGQINYKQNQIDATSDGTSGSPNYVYDSTNNQYADGSVVTTTTSTGTTGQRGIATAPVSNGNGGYSNGDWLPTVNAMMTAIASATPTISGTSNTIANFDSTGALGSGIATYDGSGTYNSSTDAGKIATAAAVETKVSKTQSTGYQVLTTGTTGTVTAEYLAVPVTTSGTGRPAANNAPTGSAAIWIE